MLHYILILFKQMTSINRRRARFVLVLYMMIPNNGIFTYFLCKLFMTRGKTCRRGDKGLQRGREIQSFWYHTSSGNVTEIGSIVLFSQLYFQLLIFPSIKSKERDLLSSSLATKMMSFPSSFLLSFLSNFSCLIGVIYFLVVKLNNCHDFLFEKQPPKEHKR